jgi:low affinity Fe/Cu permease
MRSQPDKDEPPMTSPTHPFPTGPDITDRPTGTHLESFSQRATRFVSGPWGTLTLFSVLVIWAVAIPFVGWTRAYQTIDEFITVASFILLFLIQRSQSKGMLSLHVKLNELLAAAHRASHELINVEDRTESEVQEIHDRFQEIQQRGPGAHSISDIDPEKSAGP